MRHTVFVEGREAASVADCPHKISSPEGIAWCRAFTRAQVGHAGFRADAKAAADARIEAAGFKPAPSLIEMYASRLDQATLSSIGASITGLAKMFDDALRANERSAEEFAANLAAVTAPWGVTLDQWVSADYWRRALGDAPTGPAIIDEAHPVRMIKGRPAGRKAKHERRRCVRHAKAWADSCRKCQR